MSQIIIALDYPNKKETFEFLDKFNEKLFVKIGLELFCRSGISVIQEIKTLGHKVFLDLKLHDIPNTVRSAAARLSEHEIDMLTVHCLGGNAMLRAAVEGIELSGVEKKPICVGVTQLTSSSQEMIQNELNISLDMPDSVLSLAQNAKNAGLNGVVCSVLETQKIHFACGDNFITVTPGIRLENDDKNDQKRVATPEFARDQGSNFLVIGRSITQSENPYETYKKILRSLS